jgi:hypothetical protein
VVKKTFFIFFLVLSFLLVAKHADAQCSVCTRTAQQMGEKPAKGLNAGIIYLAATPLAIIGIVAFRWWKHNNQEA